MADCLARHYFHFITLGLGLIFLYTYLIAWDEFEFSDEQLAKRSRINAFQHEKSSNCLGPIARLIIFYFLVAIRSQDIKRTLFVSTLFLCIPAEFFMYFDHYGIACLIYALEHQQSLRVMGVHVDKFCFIFSLCLLIKGRILHPDSLAKIGYVQASCILLMYTYSSGRAMWIFLTIYDSWRNRESLLAFFTRLAHFFGVVFMLLADFIHLRLFPFEPNGFFWENVFYHTGQILVVLSCADPMFDEGYMQIFFPL